jgi:thiamine biosynthesis protein ThiS
VVVVLNGLLVNPNERAGTVLKEGDELLLVSMMYGG